jgi:hypothetical protein
VLDKVFKFEKRYEERNAKKAVVAAADNENIYL